MPNVSFWFFLPLHHQFVVVSPEDAAVTEATGLATGGELYQSGGVGAGAVGRHIDTEGDDLLPTDDITVVGGDVPHPPGDALVSSGETFGDTPELG